METVIFLLLSLFQYLHYFSILLIIQTHSKLLSIRRYSSDGFIHQIDHVNMINKICRYEYDTINFIYKL